MATFETTTHPLAFAHMEGGAKTVYVVPASSDFSGVSSGDRVEFDDLGYITVGTVRRYETLPELMQAEGYLNIVPEADSEEDAIARIEAAPDWDAKKVGKHGMLALRVRSAKRAGA